MTVARVALAILSCTCFILVPAAGAASVSGTIKDPQGRPVAGASVVLYARMGATGGQTSTDSSGVFHFSELPAGNYLLSAGSAGFASYIADDIRLVDDAPTTIEIALHLAGMHEQVTVTASSTPQAPDEVSKALTVVDRTEADDRGRSSLADVVNLVPGLRVQQLGGPGAFTTIHIRGLRPQDTAVLVDGLRLRDSSATQADASGLLDDLFFTDASRVEILRGSGSSLYGTNAIGGVINVITDEGGGRTRGSLLTEGGSLGLIRGRALIAGGFHHDQIPYSFGVTHVYSGDGVDGDDPFRAINMHGRILFHLSPAMRLSARVYAGDSFGKTNSEPVALATSSTGIVRAIRVPTPVLRAYERGTPLSLLNTTGATFVPAPDDPDFTRAARFVSGALMLTGQPSPSLDYAASYQLIANSRRFGDGPAGVGFQPDGNTRSLYDGRVQTVNTRLGYRLGSHNLVSGGYEFESERFANDNTASLNPMAASSVNVTQNSHSVFAQDQARLLDDRLQLSGAFRVQYFALDRPRFSPIASAPFQVVRIGSPANAYTGDGSAAYSFRKSGTKVRVHAGRGYRDPSLFERFGAGFDPTFGYSVYGDPRLKPEHSISLDAGVDQMILGSRVRISATYFYSWLRSTIAFDAAGSIQPATDPFGRFFGYLNRPGGITRGVELSATGSPTRSLSISAAYTFVNAIERSPVAGNVIQSFVIPRNQMSILLTDRLTSRLLVTFDALASSNYLAPIFGETGTQVYRFNGIRKANIGGSYRLPLTEFKAIRFFVRAENLANQSYFENGFATPGRTGVGGIQFEF